MDESFADFEKSICYNRGEIDMHKSCAGFIVWLEDVEPNDVEAVKMEIGIKDMPCPLDNEYYDTKLFYNISDLYGRKFPTIFHLSDQLDEVLSNLYDKVDMLNRLKEKYGVSYQLLVAFSFDKNDGNYLMTNSELVDFGLSDEQIAFIHETGTNYRFDFDSFDELDSEGF